jgi:hypothetical protein
MCMTDMLRRVGLNELLDFVHLQPLCLSTAFYVADMSHLSSRHMAILLSRGFNPQSINEAHIPQAASAREPASRQIRRS